MASEVKQAFSFGTTVASKMVEVDFTVKTDATASTEAYDLSALGIVGYDTDSDFPASDLSFQRYNELAEAYETISCDGIAATESDLSAGAGAYTIGGNRQALQCLGMVKLSLSVAPSADTTIRVKAVPIG